MKLKLIIYFAATLSLSFSAVSQTWSVQGKIADKDDGDPLLGAKVEVLPLDSISTALSNGIPVFHDCYTYSASTDINGVYFISEIPLGAWLIVASYPGYLENSKIIDAQGKNALEVNFMLEFFW